MAGFWRIAIASSDGKAVDLHFDNAGLFRIVDLDESGACWFAESRPVPPLCGSDEHRPENLQYVIDTLKDCSGVLAVRVAMDVKRMMEAGATLVQVYTGFVYNGLGFPGKLCKSLIPPKEKELELDIEESAQTTDTQQ